MKKPIILLLLAAFCGGSTETSTVEATISTSTLKFQPATTIKSQYDSLSSQDKIAVKFRSYWIQNILKTDVPKLTNEELEISYNRAENPIDYFEMNDGIQCYRKTSGTKSGSVVDENYQLVFPNEFVEDDGYNIVLDDYYNCWNEDISFALFGAPFFQNGDWWTFKNIKNIDFENPGEGVYRRQSSRFKITEYFKDT
jgi:hypothetical protein